MEPVNVAISGFKKPDWFNKHQIFRIIGCFKEFDPCSDTTNGWDLDEYVH